MDYSLGLRRSKSTFIILLLLFVLASSAYVHRVPGLMGDEASEGENVYQLLQSDTITLSGERSYIGPLPDYLRVPFVGVFGYSALALRAPILVFSVLTFLLSWSVFRRLWSDEAALVVMAVVFFSPAYLTYQRLGWAITLFPFFAALLLWVGMSQWRHRALATGLVAGLGLHTHILFLPTLVAIAAVGVIVALLQSGSMRARLRRLVAWWPSLVGFWAAFATQFVILLQFTDDQGDPGAVAALFSERLADLPDLLPLLVSGSSYVARYTGAEFSPTAIWVISAVVVFLALLGLSLTKRRKSAWLWAIGLLIHTGTLLYMIDRFTLRYFVVFVLTVWVLAGLGLAGLSTRLPSPWRSYVPVVVAIVLLGWSSVAVLMPFLNTGGSVADFSLGNRTNSAAALVDTRPLISCLRGQGAVTSEGVHILNRLQYVARSDSELQVFPDTEVSNVDFLVHYRQPESPEVAMESELCPELVHFIVERRE